MKNKSIQKIKKNLKLHETCANIIKYIISRCSAVGRSEERRVGKECM